MHPPSPVTPSSHDGGHTGMRNGRGHRFTTEEKQAGLIALAMQQGNCARAARALGDDGIEVSERTLRNWKDTPAYVSVQRDVLPKVQARLAGRYEEAAALAIDKTTDALDGFTTDGLKPAEAAGAARNLMTTAGIAQDKANLLRGQPTEITERRDPQQILDGIAARFPQLVVDVDIPEAP